MLPDLLDETTNHPSVKRSLARLAAAIIYELEEKHPEKSSFNEDDVSSALAAYNVGQIDSKIILEQGVASSLIFSPYPGQYASVIHRDKEWYKRRAREKALEEMSKILPILHYGFRGAVVDNSRN